MRRYLEHESNSIVTSDSSLMVCEKLSAFLMEAGLELYLGVKVII